MVWDSRDIRYVILDGKVYILHLTCLACPEQYDVMLDGEQVGYLRLRHGSFTVEYPDCGGKLIYKAHPEGDGVFLNKERSYFICKAISAIHEEVTKQP